MRQVEDARGAFSSRHRSRPDVTTRPRVRTPRALKHLHVGFDNALYSMRSSCRIDTWGGLRQTQGGTPMITNTLGSGVHVA